ncbi:polyamine aminopropyltransferase [Eisenibacter elegans]|jgi:spermidine synthase|uniref:polyamine aminopropyltransferase n=1 Tax=Eisenibacter elegans TaxID=997 RepID=UPI000407BCDF|nr:polyamine aminopropyltransferase [Eisenibacter elegans]
MTVETLTRKRKSLILKVALFATGLSGIVAEYILSTLASYFLGDSVFQWTMIVSLMLFSMGLGSRITSWFKGYLLEIFIGIEFLLSILVSFSAMIVYIAAGYTTYGGFFIYGLCMLIGLLIGLEIPLVTRLNEAYQDLRLNIASVMEKDYYGSLLGGVFFAFVGLPYLGLTYTPFVLGGVNFGVAILLFWRLKNLVVPQYQRTLTVAAFLTGVSLLAGAIFTDPIIQFAEQQKYKDKVVFAAQSKYQKIVITQWQNDYWLYLNGKQQFCTIDEAMYHEPLVHPAMQLFGQAREILVLGGGDGCAVRELLKYPSVEKITLVDLDPLMTNLAKTQPVLLSVNDSSFFDPRVHIVTQDAFKFMADNQAYYDVIISDLPDPNSVEINRLYTREMYQMCYRYLRPNGVMITQAGSPYFATKAFECIYQTLSDAGFQAVRMHNQIITFGEWGWVLGVKNEAITPEQVKQRLRSLPMDAVPTRWINQEGVQLITSFGKTSFFVSPEEKIGINAIHNPILYRYYLKGNWTLY